MEYTKDTDTARVRRSRAVTYADIPGRESALRTAEAAELLDLMPPAIRTGFIEGFLNPAGGGTDQVVDFFVSNSELSKITKARPGSAMAFEGLYTRRVTSALDAYFLACKAGRQVYERLAALETNLPRWIRAVGNNGRVLVDNVGSGSGRDMIGVVRRNPDMLRRVHVRNIDPDGESLAAGMKMVEESGLSEDFSFVAEKIEDVEPRGAGLVLLIGVLCPLKGRLCEAILKGLRRYSRPGGLIIYSTAQTRMVTEDPLTDYVMRLMWWHMNYKSDAEAAELARSSGWEPIAQFFDEPWHFHCMTVARYN